MASDFTDPETEWRQFIMGSTGMDPIAAEALLRRAVSYGIELAAASADPKRRATLTRMAENVLDSSWWEK